MITKYEDLVLHIEEQMPLLLSKAFEEYAKRVEQGFRADAKDFVADQGACRAALSHLHLLLRISNCLPQVARDAPGQHMAEIKALVDEAEAAVAK